jgi:molecular chaperone GrpE (heat shock protein)
MTKEFEVIEEPFPVTQEVAEVDLQAEFTRLLVRCSKLENRLDDAKQSLAESQRKLLHNLLDVVDALDRILQRPLGSEDARQAHERQFRNIETTRRLLLQKLSQVGVRSVDLAGMVADPLLVDMTGYQDNPDLPDETVVREVVKAYLWNEDVLRRGQVIVSRKL